MMSAQKQHKFEGHCRLCTSVESNNLHIFDDEGEGRQLASKIRICLPIFVHREDNLPKIVCLPCVTKLESFYNFREACLKAEGTLEAFLKEEQNFPHEPEVCLEEGTSAKTSELISCNMRGKYREGKMKEDKTRRLRRKKGNENVAEDGSRLSRRGKRRKNVQTREDENFTEVNGNDLVNETKDMPKGNEAMGELPVLMCTETDLSHALIPQLKEMNPENYILIKEEKYLTPANWNIENLFPLTDEGVQNIKEEFSSDIAEKDNICIGVNGDTLENVIRAEMDCCKEEIRKEKRQFLPPVWDVFERVLHEGEETAILTHRRYIIGKKAFPCALCGNCFLLNGSGNRIENGHSESRPRSVNVKQGRDGTAERPYGCVKDETVERPYGCLRCAKRYFRRSDLVRHEKTHLDARPFVCRLCGKGFCRKEHAQRHMSLHVGEKPFQCEVCLKLFTRKEHLARHKRCHHPENLVKTEGVSTVGKGSEVEKTKDILEIATEMQLGNTSRLRLRSTTAKRAQEKVSKGKASSGVAKGSPKQPHRCDTCSKAFSRREHLVRHKRSHLREEAKASSSVTSSEVKQEKPANASVMEPIILGDRVGKVESYSCKYCHMEFCTQSRLDKHCDRMHPMAEAVSEMGSNSEVQKEGQIDNPLGDNLSAVPSSSPPCLVFESLHAELPDKVTAKKPLLHCPRCPQTFIRAESLTKHMKRIHTPLRPYSCRTCGARFGQLHQCQRHERRHQRGGIVVKEENSTKSLDIDPNFSDGDNHTKED